MIVLGLFLILKDFFEDFSQRSNNFFACLVISIINYQLKYQIQYQLSIKLPHQIKVIIDIFHKYLKLY